MRKCPRSGATLKKIIADGVELDVSEHSGGIWFDHFELNKFTDPQSAAGRKLVEHIEKFSVRISNETAQERLNCPVDHDIVMMRRFYSPKMRIQIDECPECGGIWLDPGELKDIVNLFRNETDVQKVTNRFIEEAMNNPVMQNYLTETNAFLEKLQNVVNVMSCVARTFWLGHDEKNIKEKIDDSVR